VSRTAWHSERQTVNAMEKLTAFYLAFLRSESRLVFLRSDCHLVTQMGYQTVSQMDWQKAFVMAYPLMVTHLDSQMVSWMAYPLMDYQTENRTDWHLDYAMDLRSVSDWEYPRLDFLME